MKEQIGFTEAPNMKVGKRIKGDSSKFDLNKLKDKIVVHQNRKSHGRRISGGVVGKSEVQFVTCSFAKN